MKRIGPMARWSKSRGFLDCQLSRIVRMAKAALILFQPAQARIRFRERLISERSDALRFTARVGIFQSALRGFLPRR